MNFIEYVPGNTYQDKIDFLYRCNCCERHRINKPFIFFKWVDTPFNFNKPSYNCKCNCRHISRFICRQFPSDFIVQSNIASRNNSFDSVISEF